MNKRNRLSFAIIMAFVGSTPSVFAEPLITDYQEATSAYEDAYVTGSFNLNDGNQEQASFDLDLEINYEKVISSPNRNIKFDAAGTGSRTRGPNDGDETQSSYQALSGVTMDKYFQPNTKAGFWYGKAELGGKKGQEDPFFKITGGVGYGRVINVTPMARSIRVIQELRKRRVLTSDPSNSTYQDVAKVINQEGQYRSQYGAAEYEQYWIEAIENALKASGTIAGGGDLGARAILKSYDVLVNERISTRKNGWLVRGGIGAVISNYDGSDGKPAVELGAEYHRPLSNQTQLSNEAIVTATVDNDDNSYNFNNVLSLTHEVSNRIDWENSWTLNHNESDIAGIEDVTNNTISSTYRYYLTNQLAFNVTGKLTDLEDNIDNNGNDIVDKSLNMGITYRLK
ncbi:MAG TPA: DUF481 domain-containing protein [Thiothrix sp.]|nr:DUF481 domain-containing protein [Thiothrix sp.]